MIAAPLWPPSGTWLPVAGLSRASGRLGSGQPGQRKPGTWDQSRRSQGRGRCQSAKWSALVGGAALGARSRARCGSHSNSASPLELFPVPGSPEIELEVLGGEGDGSKVQPFTLLLIHGSYHAAWCYEENFLSFFRGQGFHTYALSLRGQGRGKMVPKLPVAGALEEHASDIQAYVHHLRELHGQPVVLLGHSFGGLMVLQAAAALKDSQKGALAGLILLCSVPPAGNVGIILRSLFKAPLQALRITWGFVARAFERDAELCRQLFFDADTPAEDVGKYMDLMKEGCPEGTRLLDLRQLQRPGVCFQRIRVLPCRVSLPGDADVIVDKEACSECKASFSQRSAMGLVAPNYYFYLQPLLGLQL
ncbi:unnamed protein product [Symbiodinium sp. CCMP2592]|nr:unnamed protein product [Symbiodinium sp. CCMP2592]